MVDQEAGLFCHFVIISQDHPSLTGGHILGGVKTIGSGLAKGPYLLSPVFCPMGLGTVLNEYQIILFHQLHYLIHLTGTAIKMDDEQSPDFRVFLQFAADILWINIKGVLFYIGKDRNGTTIEDRIATGNKGKGCSQDLVSLLNACCQQRQM